MSAVQGDCRGEGRQHCGQGEGWKGAGELQAGTELQPLPSSESPFTLCHSHLRATLSAAAQVLGCSSAPPYANGWGRGSRLCQQLTCALFILEWVGLSCLLHAGTPKLRLKLKRGSGASPALEMFVTAASRILPVTPKLAAALPTVVHRAEQSRWGS